MLKIRNVCIGSGIVKICVPLTSATLDGLIAEAKLAKSSGADLVEWRADFFDAVLDSAALAAAASKLREILGEMPVLFTFRTVPEGGMRKIGQDDYLRINLGALNTREFDLIDIELSSGEKICREIIGAAKNHAVATILSAHDFNGTAPLDELLATMKKAPRLGGDIAKLAVTAKTPADVITLLHAGALFAQEHPGCPAITISMGALGKISRLSGEISGSCVTFASLATATAPGQLSVGEMREILRMLHE